MNRQELARLGETTACDYLAGAGFALRHRNWHCPGGEIDIVAEKAGGLVMVEVKTRSSMHYGAGEEAVTPRKLARIERCAWAYLGAHALLEQPWRVDVIAVDVDRQGRVTRLNHLEDVLQT
ncbi:MAG: YraN family protein [Anaerolineales bacterium]|nr:YraN family protein [Anaerolineales bacterium]